MGQLKIMNLNVIVIMTLLINIAVPLHAEEKSEVTCEQALNACDETLSAADSVINEQRKLISEQEAAQAAYLKRIEELEKKQQSIFRNPVLWLGMGLAAGVVGGTVLGVVITR